ncbi:Fructose-1,6-bisphosphatase, type I [hydrothermal vent metagenome]|uniref:fructose-bisphosphatase n=1 Tax=hydrothermal vent metagenome TaxID=652676 RepID=A0A3B0U871_9ZZZZ
MSQYTSIEKTPGIPAPLLPVIVELCQVSQKLAQTIADGELAGDLGAAAGSNLGGDEQKALDLIADKAYMAALKDSDVRWYASEERDDVVELNPMGTLAIAIDPLDGSSNIGVNISIGSIFSIFAAKDEGLASFLRPANEQIAAGYFIYGPQTQLVVTFGAGTMRFLLDTRTREFICVEKGMKIPPQSSEYAINASNYRHWPKPIRAFVDDCVEGTKGPRGRDFNMRWIASLVAETHRILTRGGVFLYPADNRKGYQNGRLRMVYECAPIAFLIEEAGGKATDAIEPILAQQAKSLHARVPFVFGSANKVEKIAAYHDLPENEISALFGKRGLFRD